LLQIFYPAAVIQIFLGAIDSSLILSSGYLYFGEELSSLPVSLFYSELLFLADKDHCFQ